MTRRHRIWASIAALTVLPPTSLLMASSATAATACSVTSTADSGPGSLRQALLALDSSNGADCSAISITAIGTIALQSKLPIIGSSVAITGPGALALTIDGGGQHPILTAALPANGLLAVSRLSLAHGEGAECAACNDIGATSGGAIRATAKNAKGAIKVSDVTFTANTSTTSGGAIWAGSLPVTIINSTFTENRAEGDEGGAVEAGAATVVHSTFTGNFSGGDGGAISADWVHIRTSTFTGNQAADGGALSFMSTRGGHIASTTFDSNSTTGQGGAVYAWAFDQRATSFLDCRFTGNSADLDGGAISAQFNDEFGKLGPRGALTISRSTFDGNDARRGGAVSSDMFASTSATNATFTGNRARGSGGAMSITRGGSVSLRFITIVANAARTAGGGIRARAASLSLLDSIVWGNTAKTGSDLSDASKRATVSYTVFSLPTSVVMPSTRKSPGVIYGRDPLLAPLADNGGPAPTMLPAAGSPVINAGAKVPGMPRTDQRGLPRTTGNKPDLGAVEID